jgi:2-(1,2-epoxy-1,2-dihydrophenyl)acetyl-CoA isomerase
MNDSVLCAYDGPIVTLTLNRVASLNALDASLIDALLDHTFAIAGDDSIRCVVVNGAGKHFMAGGDIVMLGEHLNYAVDERSRRFDRIMRRVHAIIETLQRMPHPIVASIRGAVAGFGMSLACACDLVVASETTVFTSAYRNLGLTPDGGLTYFLPRLVGIKKAMEIIQLGDRFDAAEALRIGIINRLVPDAELAAATRAIADSLAAGPTTALRNAKRLINGSMAHSLSQQLAAEARSFAACCGTTDFAAGVAAFVAKRPPRFGAT